jgi:hypothetical protein
MRYILHHDFFLKEVARGGEQTRVLSISFIFSFFTTLTLSHSGTSFTSRLSIPSRCACFQMPIARISRASPKQQKNNKYLAISAVNWCDHIGQNFAILPLAAQFSGIVYACRVVGRDI